MEHFRIGRLHRGHLVKLPTIMVVKSKDHINEMIYLQRALVKEYEIKNISTFNLVLFLLISSISLNFSVTDLGLNSCSNLLIACLLVSY